MCEFIRVCVHCVRFCEFILQCSLPLPSIVFAIMIAAIASSHKFVFVAILLQSIHVNCLNNDAGAHLVLVSFSFSFLSIQHFSYGAVVICFSGLFSSQLSSIEN